MKDPLAALLAPQSLESNLFPPTSRYHGLPTAEWTSPQGESVKYLRRRFVPDPAKLDDAGTVAVRPEDRTDLLAARALGDPELFWRLADGNGALAPQELTEKVGKKLRVTLPQGVPGSRSGG